MKKKPLNTTGTEKKEEGKVATKPNSNAISKKKPIKAPVSKKSAISKKSNAGSAIKKKKKAVTEMYGADKLIKGEKFKYRYLNRIVSISDPNLIKQNLKINTIKDVLIQCGNCSMCMDECPTYSVRQSESCFAGGRLRTFRTVVERRLPITEDFVETMYFCTSCNQCGDICPRGIDCVGIIEGLKTELVKRKIGPFGKLLGFTTSIRNNQNPYGELAVSRKDWLTGAKDINEVTWGDYAYFVGCTASYRTKEIAQNTAKILTKVLGGIVLLGPEEFCCGSPLIRTGQTDFELIDNYIVSSDKKVVHFSVEEYVKNNIEKLTIRDVKTVIYSCSACLNTSINDWPKYFPQEIPFERIHITEFLSDMIKRDKVKFKELKKKITYHDPCNLGRHLKIYDPPRDVLKAIPGVEFIEMRKSRNRTRCCGAGGGVKTAFPQDSIMIATTRLKEAIATGADILATSCVFCKYNFLDANRGLGNKIEIKLIEDIIVDYDLIE